MRTGEVSVPDKYPPAKKKVIQRIAKVVKSTLPNLKEVHVLEGSDFKKAAKDARNGLTVSESTDTQLLSGKNTLYGFVQNGHMYLNGDKLNANTPVHEGSHLFTQWAKDNSPELYREGLNKMAGTQYLKEVKADSFYAKQAEQMRKEGASEAEIKDFYRDEALAIAVGDSGQKLSIVRKNQFLQWLSRFWNNVREAFGKGSPVLEKMSTKEIRNMPLADFSDAVAGRLLSGRRLMGENLQGQTSGAQFMSFEDRRKNIREAGTRFIQELKNYVGGKLGRSHVFQLGVPSNKLLAAGFRDKPIELQSSQLGIKETQHGIKPSEIADLPDALANPIAVFQSKTKVGSKVVLTEMQKDGINMVVAVKMGGDNTVNSVRSIYPKDNINEILSWIDPKDADLMEWVDKEKALSWLDKHQSNSGDVAKRAKGLTKVVKDFENPSIEENGIRSYFMAQSDPYLSDSDFDENGNVKPEVIEEIRKERNTIEQEAKANGTWMKAPNGKPTKLTESQWVTVRAKRFKRWFGDWENVANLLNSGLTESEITKTLKIKKYATEVIANRKEIRRLSQDAERGRKQGGIRNVEATILLTTGGKEFGKITGREAQQQTIEDYAKQNGIWHENIEANPDDGTHHDGLGVFKDSGVENQVYVPKGNPKIVRKAMRTTNPFNKDNPNEVLEYLDTRISEHNGGIGASVPYTVVGFGRLSNGEFVVVSEQPHIQNARLATVAEISVEMRKRGYEPDGKHSYGDENYFITDINPKNVLVDEHGNLHFIDTMIDSLYEANEGDYTSNELESQSNPLEDISKVTDPETGEPLVVYHGTGTEITEFDKKKAHDIEGRKAGVGFGKNKFYLSESPETAAAWAERSVMRGEWAGKSIRGNKYGSGESPQIIEAFLNIKNPISGDAYLAKLDKKTRPNEYQSGRVPQSVRDAAIAQLDKELKKEGVDGIRGEFNPQVAAFYPNQIKSATGNIGTFSSETNDIRYQSAVQLENSEKVEKVAESILNEFAINQDKGVTLESLKQRARKQLKGDNRLDSLIEDAYFEATKRVQISERGADGKQIDDVLSGVEGKLAHAFNKMFGTSKNK